MLRQLVEGLARKWSAGGIPKCRGFGILCDKQRSACAVSCDFRKVTNTGSRDRTNCSAPPLSWFHSHPFNSRIAVIHESHSLRFPFERRTYTAHLLLTSVKSEVPLPVENSIQLVPRSE
jgi:hypothetical protein